MILKDYVEALIIKKLQITHPIGAMSQNDDAPQRVAQPRAVCARSRPTYLEST